VAAGVNQDRDVGYLFLSGADPWDLEAWRTIDVSTLLGDDPTWMRGVCRNGPTIVALGEYSRDARGIVLMSADDGATWTDVGSSLYGGTIDAGTTEAPSVNPLKGRRGLVGKRAGFPAFANATLDLGRTYAGKNVRIRFRVGTDEGTGLHGWELDDLAFSGITNTPFPSQVADTCTP